MASSPAEIVLTSHEPSDSQKDTEAPDDKTMESPQAEKVTEPSLDLEAPVTEQPSADPVTTLPSVVSTPEHPSSFAEEGAPEETAKSQDMSQVGSRKQMLPMTGDEGGHILQTFSVIVSLIGIAEVYKIVGRRKSYRQETG